MPSRSRKSVTAARHAWMTAHTVLGILFSVFILWHLVLNHHALWRHVRGVRAPVSREVVFAAAFVALVLAVAVGHAFHVG